MDGPTREGPPLEGPILDHLVFAVPDLRRGIEAFGAKLGVEPASGGRHEGMATHNALLRLGGRRYIELIAADPGAPEPPRPRPFGLDSLEGPRLVTWAVRTTDIEATARRSRERGYDPGIVFAMSRARPDGETLHWKLSLRADPFGEGLVPFLIDWGDAEHPAGDGEAPAPCALESFEGVHPKPEPIRAALAALGAKLAIRIGVTARLEAVISGPGGKLELR